MSANLPSVLTITSLTTATFGATVTATPIPTPSPDSAPTGVTYSPRFMVAFVWIGICIGVPLMVGGFIFGRRWCHGLKRPSASADQSIPHGTSTTAQLGTGVPAEGNIDLEGGNRQSRCLPIGRRGHKRHLAKVFNALMDMKIRSTTAFDGPPIPTLSTELKRATSTTFGPPPSPAPPRPSVNEGSDSATSDPPPPYCSDEGEDARGEWARPPCRPDRNRQQEP